MNNYALTFVVDPLSEETEDRILGAGMMPSTLDQLNQVMTLSRGATCLDAAREAARRLSALGPRVQRLDLDLVNQAEIADRVGMSRAAVNKWVHCQDPGQSFPAPHTAAPALLWAWGDVNEWLRRHKTACCDDARTPNAAEVTAFNAWWDNERSQHPMPGRWGKVVRPGLAADAWEFDGGLIVISAGGLVCGEVDRV